MLDIGYIQLRCCTSRQSEYMLKDRGKAGWKIRNNDTHDCKKASIFGYTTLRLLRWSKFDIFESTLFGSSQAKAAVSPSTKSPSRPYAPIVRQYTNWKIHGTSTCKFSFPRKFGRLHAARALYFSTLSVYRNLGRGGNKISKVYKTFTEILRRIYVVTTVWFSRVL